MKAHVGHGDYLGFCQAKEDVTPGTGEDPVTQDPGQEATDPTAGDQSGTTDPTNTGSETDVSDVFTPVTEGDSSAGNTTANIPLWCEPFVDKDANCDGIDDITGESYF